MKTLRVCLLLLLAWAPLGAQPKVVPAADWGSKPQPIPQAWRQVPRRLVIHHAGVVWKPEDDPRRKLLALQSWGQREKGWPDLPYHYLIAPSGEIFAGRDWHFRPESNTRYNLDGVITVMLWGDFEQQRVTLPQLTALVELLAQLCRDHCLRPEGLSSHRRQAPGQTTCPGRDLSWYLESGWLTRWVRQALIGADPQPQLHWF